MTPRIIIVNEQDEIIGHKERGTLHQNDIYRVTGLWVTNSKGEILLAQRALTKSHDPGKWGPAAAGTIDEGETYDDNVIKEAGEELGLRGVHPAKGPKLRMRGKHQYFVQWYTLTADQPAEAFVIPQDEVVAVRWIQPEQLKKELAEHPELYLAGMATEVAALT